MVRSTVAKTMILSCSNALKNHTLTQNFTKKQSNAVIKDYYSLNLTVKNLSK